MATNGSEKLSLGSFLGILSALVTVIVLIGLSYLLHFKMAYTDFVLTVIVAVAGVTIGWLLGFLAAPLSLEEKERFGVYAATLSAFMSGYLLSKIEPWISAMVNEGSAGNKIFAARLFIFIACVLVGAISMYTFRLNLFRGKG